MVNKKYTIFSMSLYEIVSDGSSIFVFHKLKGDFFLVTTESSFKALSNMHLINSTFLSFP